jgi:uncharacterized protein YwqG
LIWTPLEGDYPSRDDLCEAIKDEQILIQLEEANVGAAEGTKIGGWPFTIQSEIQWAPHDNHPAKPEFVFQIDSEAETGWEWGHQGIGYFGRGTAPDRQDEWVLAWQCL